MVVLSDEVLVGGVHLHHHFDGVSKRFPGGGTNRSTKDHCHRDKEVDAHDEETKSRRNGCIETWVAMGGLDIDHREIDVLMRVGDSNVVNLFAEFLFLMPV